MEVKEIRRFKSLCLLLICAISPLFSQTSLRLGDLMFLINKSDETSNAEVIGNFINSDTVLSIPPSIIVDGVEYTVTSIGDQAFKGCDFITSVILPNTIKTIGRASFADCKNLIEFHMDDSVEDIGDYAFQLNRLRSILLSKNLIRVGNYAFANGGPNQIIIPPSVQYIGECAFYGKTKIAFPRGAVCESNAFLGSYTKGIIEYDPSDCCIVGDCLYNFDQTSILFVPNNYDIFDVPINVTEIGCSAFFYCEKLQSVSLNNVERINDSAFSQCMYLSEIKFSNCLVNIGENAFTQCYALSSINLPDGIRTIGKYAFSSCSALTSIAIPGSVTEIGDYAFMKSVYQNESKIREVYYKTQKPIVASKNIFSEDVYRNGILYIEEGGYDGAINTLPWIFFSTINIYDFSNVKNIILDSFSESPLRIYNLNGLYIGNNLEEIPSGVYMIMYKGKTIKIMK